MTSESVKSAKNRNRVGQKARVPQPQEKTKTATMMTLACMKLSGTRSLLLFRNELPALLAKTSEGLNRKSTILTTLTSSRFWEKAVLGRYCVQTVALFRFSFSRGRINRLGVWVVVRASCVAYRSCGLLVKDKQTSVPFMKSEIAFHWAQKAGDCHSCFYFRSRRDVASARKTAEI